jgi:hypothetical protein
MTFHTLLPKIALEGYCCVNGYLRLCRARGESLKSMAENISIPYQTLWYNYGQLEKGNRPCKQYSDCMGPIIEEIEKEKKVNPSEDS